MPESEVKITGNTTSYEGALTRAGAAQARWSSDTVAGAETASRAVEGLAEEMRAFAVEQAKAAAGGLGDLAKSAGEVAGALAEGSEAAKKLASARQAEADLVEQQVRKLKALGAEQREIDELVKLELSLRADVAELLGDSAGQAKIAARQEIEGVRAVARAARESDEQREAAKRERARLEVEAERTAKAAAKDTGETQLAYIRAEQAEIRRSVDIRKLDDDQAKAAAADLLSLERQALELEKQQAGSKAEQLAIDQKIADVVEKQNAASSGGGGGGAGDIGGASKLGGMFDGASAGAGALLKTLGGFTLAAAGIGAVGGALGQVVDVLDSAAEKSYAMDTASRSLQISIDGARAAAGGMATDFEIAGAANKAFALGAVETGDEFANFVAGVKVKAEEMGLPLAKALDQATTAVSRGSAEILDNVGVAMTRVEAEQLYAKSLGVSVESLTAYQKANAASKGMLIAITSAADGAAQGVDSMASSWKQAKVELENYRNGMFGFKADAGTVREKLRQLDGDVLALFGSRKTEDVNALDRELKKLGITYEDVAAVANELGNVEEMRGGQLDYENRKKQEKELIRLANEAIKFQDKRIQQAAVAEAQAAKAARVKELEDEALGLERAAELLGFQEGKEIEILRMSAAAIDLRKKAADEIEDQNKKLERQAELDHELNKLLAAPIAKKSGGSGKNEAKEAAKIQQDMLEAEIAGRLELAKMDRDDARSRQARRFDTLAIVELEHEQLDVRRKLIEALPEKTRTQRAEKAKEAAALERDVELQRRAEITTTSAFEREAMDERIAGLDREIERNEALGASTKLLAEVRRQAAQEQVDKFGTIEEQAQFAHDQDVARITTEREAALTKADAELEAHNARMELREAEGFAVDDLFERRIQLELRVAAVEKDLGKRREILHRADLQRIKMRQQAEQRALQASSQALGIAGDFGRTIINAAIKDDAKRERASLRLAGVQALGRAALETVEAVASFARYDFIGGALHTAAAAVGYVQGGIMLAGRIPSQGGGAAGAGAGAATGGGDAFGQGFGDSQKKNAAAPLSTDLDDARGGGKSKAKAGAKSDGGTVINFNAPVVTGDSSYLLKQVADKKAASWGT